MRGIWLKVVPPAINEYTRLEPATSLLWRIRTNALYQGMFAVWRRTILPNVFGLATLLILMAVATVAIFGIVDALIQLLRSVRL
jgi:hypothetical protein